MLETIVEVLGGGKDGAWVAKRIKQNNVRVVNSGHGV
jgi:hypothetical protein